MRRMFVLAVMCVLLIGACGDDGGDTEAEADTPVADDDASDEDGSDDGAGDDDGSDDGAGGEDSSDDGAGGIGTATIDGTVYEFPDVRDCGLGDTGFPNDRDFVGYSADGEVVMTVGYFEDESLAGLNSVSVEIDDPHALYSSQYAPDGEFMIDVRPDGADGSATVGAVGIDVTSGDREATWSFTC